MSEKILDRVRKLLALANDERATEGERDNALRMAHATLAKHQLDMLDVDKHVRDKDDPRGTYLMDGWGIPWCRSIRNTVAKLFNCRYYSQKINTTKYRHFYVGRESNATTAMMMADWIVLALLREADKRYGHRLTPGGRSFGEGASHKLYKRVEAMLEEKGQEYQATGYAVALLDEDALNDALLPADLRTGKQRKANYDVSAFYDGHAHADGISLNTQLANKKGTLAVGVDPVVAAANWIWNMMRAGRMTEV